MINKAADSQLIFSKYVNSFDRCSKEPPGGAIEFRQPFTLNINHSVRTHHCCPNLQAPLSYVSSDTLAFNHTQGLVSDPRPLGQQNHRVGFLGSLHSSIRHSSFQDAKLLIPPRSFLTIYKLDPLPLFAIRSPNVEH
jgi:hypothetical protein